MALKDQGPFTRFVRNLLKGHVLGLFYKRSHFNENGTPKVRYNTKETATKAAKRTSERHKKYKCIYCDGYHLGKNRDNK